MADQKLQQAVKRFMTNVAKGFEAYLKRMLNIKYPRASVPGEFPRKRTGSLQASVGFEQHRTKNGEVSITIGIVRDVQLGGKKERPTLYGAILEEEMMRLLVEQAFDEYWRKIDHSFLVRLDGSKISKRITVRRLTEYGRTELFDLVGLDDLFEEDAGQTTLTGMSS